MKTKLPKAIYCTILLTDKFDAIDVIPKIEHKAFPIKHVIWDTKVNDKELKKIRKLIDLGVKHLNMDEVKEDQEISSQNYAMEPKEVYYATTIKQIILNKCLDFYEKYANKTKQLQSSIKDFWARI